MYDYIQTQDNVYIITEFCDGGDMNTLILSKGRIKEDQAIKFAKDIIQGMKEMKLKGVVHRDIKPANILICDGFAKIADLGFCTFEEENKVKGSTFGSPLYMSPESLHSGFHTVKSDIWSLGVTLY